MAGIRPCLAVLDQGRDLWGFRAHERGSPGPYRPLPAVLTTGDLAGDREAPRPDPPRDAKQPATPGGASRTPGQGADLHERFHSLRHQGLRARPQVSQPSRPRPAHAPGRALAARRRARTITREHLRCTAVVSTDRAIHGLPTRD